MKKISKNKHIPAGSELEYQLIMAVLSNEKRTEPAERPGVDTVEVLRRIDFRAPTRAGMVEVDSGWLWS